MRSRCSVNNDKYQKGKGDEFEYPYVRGRTNFRFYAYEKPRVILSAFLMAITCLFQQNGEYAH
jgi:hypothetical protein